MDELKELKLVYDNKSCYSSNKNSEDRKYETEFINHNVNDDVSRVIGNHLIKLGLISVDLKHGSDRYSIVVKTSGIHVSKEIIDKSTKIFKEKVEKHESW